jgi:RNA 2',3'-cyclic 3'-phosphodiesterase
MSETIRTFIAVETPPEFKIRAEMVQRELATVDAPVKWDESYKMHITLKFLGDTHVDILPDLETKLKAVTETCKSVWVRYHSLGCFPHRKNPRVLWIGCTPLSSALDHLYREIETVCVDFGFEPEKRSFHPHVTIGRVKIRSGKDHRAARDLIKKMETVTFEPLEDQALYILLMRSELRPDGAVYSILKKFSLAQ